MRAFLSMSLMAALLALPEFCQARTQAKAAKAEKAPDLAAGRTLFESQCGLCHGLDGSGFRGPDLRRPKLSHAADDAALQTVISWGISPQMPQFWFLGQEEVANVAAFVRSLGKVPGETLRGNVQHGEVLYRANGCVACHIRAGEGVGLGPELTEIGLKRGAAQLRTTLRSPAESLPEGFVYLETVTPGGERVRGIRLNEDSFDIQIKDIQNRIFSFHKSDLRELRRLRNETPMPSYEGVLSAGDLEDVVAFLASQRGAP